jgi:hypothetical protein
LRKYLGTRVIWAFREIFNGNLMVMTLKGKKLYPDDIQDLFTMAYKGLTTFAMTYKELGQIIIRRQSRDKNTIVTLYKVME